MKKILIRFGIPAIIVAILAFLFFGSSSNTDKDKKFKDDATRAAAQYATAHPAEVEADKAKACARNPSAPDCRKDGVLVPKNQKTDAVPTTAVITKFNTPKPAGTRARLALTFDVGSKNLDSAESMLKVLNEAHVKATFFFQIPEFKEKEKKDDKKEEAKKAPPDKSLPAKLAAFIRKCRAGGHDIGLLPTDSAKAGEAVGANALPDEFMTAFGWAPALERLRASKLYGPNDVPQFVRLPALPKVEQVQAFTNVGVTVVQYTVDLGTVAGKAPVVARDMGEQLFDGNVVRLPLSMGQRGVEAVKLLLTATNIYNGGEEAKKDGRLAFVSLSAALGRSVAEPVREGTSFLNPFLPAVPVAEEKPAKAAPPAAKPGEGTPFAAEASSDDGGATASPTITAPPSGDGLRHCREVVANVSPLTPGETWADCWVKVRRADQASAAPNP